MAGACLSLCCDRSYRYVPCICVSLVTLPLSVAETRTPRRPAMSVTDIYHAIPYHTIPYHTMGVLPSTQPVATLGSSFILSSFDMACTCCVPYVEATVFGVGMNVGCDDCNNDGRTSPGSAIAMERGEASTVRMRCN